MSTEATTPAYSYFIDSCIFALFLKLTHESQRIYNIDLVVVMTKTSLISCLSVMLNLRVTITSHSDLPTVRGFASHLLPLANRSFSVTLYYRTALRKSYKTRKIRKERPGLGPYIIEPPEVPSQLCEIHVCVLMQSLLLPLQQTYPSFSSDG